MPCVFVPFEAWCLCQMQGGTCVWGRERKEGFSALCWIYVAWVSGGMRYDVDSEGQHVCWRWGKSLWFFCWCLMLREANIVLSITYMKNMKNCQRYRCIFAPRIDSKGSYIQEESPLFYSFAFWAKRPGRVHLLLLLRKSHLRTALCSTLTMGGTSSRGRCVAARWTLSALFLLLVADKCIWFKTLKRRAVFCVCMHVPKSPLGSL